MLLTTHAPRLTLAPHIERIWTFESECGIPTNDLRTIVPNGRMKLIIPYRSPLSSVAAGRHTLHPESTMLLVGQMEGPAVIGAEGRVGTIGIEFKPGTAYRFFAIPLQELSDRVLHADDVLGSEGRRLQEELGEQSTVKDRIALVEAFLVRRLIEVDRSDMLVDHAVALIAKSGGRMTVEELSRRMGYTRRFLNMRFAERVGVSPKMLACITRFQGLYSQVVSGSPKGLYPDKLYDAYHDQSHYIRDFKRFTGRTPSDFARVGNDFGKVFRE